MMEWYWALLMMIGLLVALMAIGMPVAFAFFGANIVGAYFFLGGMAGMVQMTRNGVAAVTSYSLSPIPFFILMGGIMFHTGLAYRAIDAVEQLFAKVPGRLSLVSVTGGTIFAALSGSSMANAAMMGKVLLPEMTRRGYHPTMSMGPILATGGLAVLIPPSSLAVLLGSLAQIPVADLLLGGIVPGLMLAAFYFGYILVRCTLNPRLAPAYEVPSIPFAQRIRPFLVNVVPLLLLFVVIVGSILGGLATPTESAALGAVGAIIAAALYRTLTVDALRKALMETALVTVMAFFIIAASVTYAQVLTFSGAVDGLLDLIAAMNLGPGEVIAVVVVILLILGMLVDPLSMMLLTLPFFMPMAQATGLDPVWFGVLMLVLMEIGFITPPFGLLLFVMKGVAPPDVTMNTIIRAAIPYIVLQLLAVLILIQFPALITWLPGLAAK
jgi:tripartite ATP-independent transporter DctM subunit